MVRAVAAGVSPHSIWQPPSDMTCDILATTSSPNSDGAVTVTSTVNSLRSPDATTALQISYNSLPCVPVKCA